MVVTIFLGWYLACVISSQRYLVADDAYITYIYGRNLAEGYGLRYNPTDFEPTSGASEILHVFISAVFHRTGFDPLNATRGLGIVLFMTIPVAFAIASGKITGVPLGNALLIANCLAFAYAQLRGTAWHLASGLGTVLFTALHAWVVAWAAYAVAREPRMRTWTGFASALLLFALALARPEGMALAAGYIIAIVLAKSQLAGHGRVTRQTIIAAMDSVRSVLILFTLGSIALFAWKVVTFGDPLLNPYYVKVGNQIFGSSGAWLPGLSTTVTFFALQYVPLAGIIILGAILLDLDRLVWRGVLWLFVPSLFSIAIYSRAIHEMAGGFRYEYPFLVPLFGTLVLISTLLYARGRSLSLVAIAVISLSVSLLFSPDTSQLVQWALRPISSATAWWSFRNEHNQLAHMGLDLANTGLGSRATILLSGAGQVPYFSRFRAIDWIGLNNNYLSGRYSLTLDEVWRYIDDKKPDIVYSNLPPATSGANHRDQDRAFQSPGVQLVLSGQGSVLFAYWNSERVAQMFYREMEYIRDYYQFGACYELNRNWWLFAYVRRDSPYRVVLLSAFGNSAWVDRTSDLSRVFHVDPRTLGQMNTASTASRPKFLPER